MRVIPGLVLVAPLAVGALAAPNPDGVGTLAPNGSAFTADIGPAPDDTDEYVFQGYPGMVLSAVAKSSKGSALRPHIDLVRPGGTVVSDDEGIALTITPTSATVKFAIDTTGWWQVRVRSADGSGGEYKVTVKYSTPKLAAVPLVSKGFRAAGSVAPVNDVDDFVFQGYAGQTLNAQLKLAKGSTLDPQVQLIAPDGTSANSAGVGTIDKSLVIARSLDADGLWRLRVLGEEIDPAPPHSDLSTGAYSLKVKLGKPLAVGLRPDANGQYRVVFPAVGGALIGYSLSYTADKANPTATPTFNSFRDPLGNSIPGFPGGLSLKSFTIPATRPIGEYALTFDAPAVGTLTNVQVTRTLVLPKSDPKRTARFASLEPVIRTNGIQPTEGGPGTLLSVQVSNVIDPNDSDGAPMILLDHTPLLGVTLQSDQVTLRGTVPDGLAEGVYDVVVLSTSGQAASKEDAFRRVPPPSVSGIDPTVGTEGGGFPITITGSGFRPGRMGILLEGALQPVTPDPQLSTDTSVTFTAPSRAPGFVVFGVKDLDTQLVANLPLNSFEYVATPAVSRIVPSLIPVLGNETVTVQGANFSAEDTVFLETTPGSGVYTAITTPSNPTFVNSRQHQFLAPPRARGVYRIHVQDDQGQPNPPKTRALTYYSFADATTGTNLGSIGPDDWDGVTTAIGDYDKDGDADLFVARRGDPAAAVPEQDRLTRVLRNEGAGQFADVTAAVIPEVGADDWRADRIWVADVTQDTYPDLLIATNTKLVPGPDASHTRILVNEAAGGVGGNAAARVFRDRTVDLMAPVRKSKKYGLFGGDASEYVSDAWRALDMWVGDIDKGAAGPPEIVITHDEVKDDDNYNTDVFDSGIYCGNYCSTGGASFQYAYTFYWGGSRMFVWDKSSSGGKGRYKFDAAFFPRRSGPLVPTPIPGVGVLNCSTHYNSKCKDTFTPFTGQRVAVGSIDGDTKPDVAILSNKVVQRKAKINDPLLTTSSLQVGLNVFNPKEGSGVTDMTGVIFNLGGTTLADAVAIGQPGFSDGNSYGVIATSRAAQQGTGSVLRLYRFLPGASPGSFDDVTSAALPAVTSADTYQASAIAWLDVDQDGDQDLVLLAAAAPGGTASALRIYRNERVGFTVGNLRKTLLPLLDGAVTATEHFEGDSLSIGDVTGDAVIDYVVTRALPSGSGSQLRIIRTDK